MLRGEVQHVQTPHTNTPSHFCPAGNHPGILKGHAKCKQVTLFSKVLKQRFGIPYVQTFSGLLNVISCNEPQGKLTGYIF